MDLIKKINMSGMEILDTQIITTVTGGFNVPIFLITFFLSCIIGAIWGIFYSGGRDDEFGPICSTLLGCLVGLCIGALLGAVGSTPIVEKTEIQYKVTLSDEVSLNDFLERYEILEQEGKILTIVEKEEN